MKIYIIALLVIFGPQLIFSQAPDFEDEGERQYCATVFTQMCPCDDHVTDLVFCGGSFSCALITVNKTYISSTKYQEFLTVNTNEGPDHNIFARVDPDSGFLCLIKDTNNSLYEDCFRPYEMINWFYYIYANSAYASRYYLDVARVNGSCNNQYVESEEERLQYFPLCSEEINQYGAEDGPLESITVERYDCLNSNCGSPVKQYTISKNQTLHTHLVNKEAFGIRFTGRKICFSFVRRTEFYYVGYDLDPTITSTCLNNCFEVNSFTSFSAEYMDYTGYSSYKSQHMFVMKTSINPNGIESSGHLSINHSTMLVQLFVVLFILVLAF